MSELTSPGKAFEISKGEVWQPYERVKANKGAPGVGEQSLEAFEAGLKNNLFKIWNRMSSGSYFPPPVKALEIPKPGGCQCCGDGAPKFAKATPRRTSA